MVEQIACMRAFLCAHPPAHEHKDAHSNFFLSAEKMEWEFHTNILSPHTRFMFGVYNLLQWNILMENSEQQLQEELESSVI